MPGPARLRIALASVVLAAALLAGGPATAERARAYPPLFGTIEVKSGNLQPFPKWTGALERYFAERRNGPAPCEPGWFTRCPIDGWKTFLAEMRGKDARAQIAAVNAYLNEAPYIIDLVNYGVPDYWATPLQFLARDGDCEDYAIAKFMSLRALGFANDDMRIVVLQDLNLRIAHAVLVVYRDGRAWVLDNQIGEVVPAETIRHYRPVYSVNETAWWLHRSAKPPRTALLGR